MPILNVKVSAQRSKEMTIVTSNAVSGNSLWLYPESISSLCYTVIRSSLGRPANEIGRYSVVLCEVTTHSQQPRPAYEQDFRGHHDPWATLC